MKSADTQDTRKSHQANLGSTHLRFGAAALAIAFPDELGMYNTIMHWANKLHERAEELRKAEVENE